MVREDKIMAGHFRASSLRTRFRTETSRLEDRAGRLEPALARLMMARKDRVAGFERLLRTLGYKETLARGYAVVRAGEKVVTGVAAAKAAQALEIEFSDGRLDVATGGVGAPKKRKDGGSDQGSLF